MIKSYLQKMYADAYLLNTRNIITALESIGQQKIILDVGCWDGIATQDWIKAAKAKIIYGIEPIRSAATKAQSLGIKTHIIEADKKPWPIADNTIDCIVSNQVVEHLSDLDRYFSEVSRVLKPGGYVVTSTNNLSSLHNIFALVMGWAPFDLTNSSSKSLGIGNPLAIHQGEKDMRGKTWTHKTIYTARWLFEWQRIYQLQRVELYGAGLYPFPSQWGNVLKNNCAFITTVCKKTL